MRKFFYPGLLTIFILGISCNLNNKINTSLPIPDKYLGKFEDDYGINYKISARSFVQLPGTSYNIIEWNKEDQYIIAQNSEQNGFDKSLFTRIDYMDFKNMEPFTWGFCLTAYKAASVAEAKNTASADRSNPKKGCNGFPFSRLKRIN